MSSRKPPLDCARAPKSSSDEGNILPPFDIADFDDTDIQLPERLRTTDSLIARFNRDAEQYKEEQLSTENTPSLLFPEPPSDKESDSQNPQRYTCKLWSIISRAYADVRCDRSIDYVVADPEANLLFLQRCWELGAAAAPFELNWILMNARKDGKLGAHPRAKRFSIGKEELDHFSFAIDIAMRAVQERLYYSEQRQVSIDHVLCDPLLANEFDALAQKLVPERSRLECRWTSMALRKARRSCPSAFRFPKFDDGGFLEDVRIHRLPVTGGAYWLSTSSGSLFTGVATNLRKQVDSLVQRIGYRIYPPWINERSNEKPTIALCETDSLENSEIIRAGIFRYKGSRLNFWNGSFFGTAA